MPPAQCSMPRYVPLGAVCMRCGGRANTSAVRTPRNPANPYHFDDVERLADEHLSRTVSAPSRDPCSRHSPLLTCAMPPAVPAVRSISVFDILRLVLEGVAGESEEACRARRL